MQHLLHSNNHVLLNRDDDDDEHHNVAITTSTSRHSSPPSSSWEMTTTATLISPNCWWWYWWWCHTKLVAMTSSSSAVVCRTSEAEVAVAAAMLMATKASSPPLTMWIPPLQPDEAVQECYHHSGSNDSRMLDECPVPFPIRLHRLLLVDDVSSIISWDANGQSFHIHNVTKFIFDILPRYFHQTKLTSFRRQMQIYGFRQITSSSKSSNCQQHHGSYYHKFFVRDRPDLCHYIVLRHKEQHQRQRRMPPQPPPCEHSCHSLMPLPLPLSPTLPSSVVGTETGLRRINSISRGTKMVRSYPGDDASYNMPTFYGIPSHPLPLPVLFSSSSSQSSTITNHTVTSIISSDPIRKDHGNGEDGGMKRSQTCHDVPENQHDDSDLILFRPLPMKPRLPSVIMTRKRPMST